jgi:hypothetical protein
MARQKVRWRKGRVKRGRRFKGCAMQSRQGEEGLVQGMVVELRECVGRKRDAIVFMKHCPRR